MIGRLGIRETGNDNLPVRLYADRLCFSLKWECGSNLAVAAKCIIKRAVGIVSKHRELPKKIPISIWIPCISRNHDLPIGLERHR